MLFNISTHSLTRRLTSTLPYLCICREYFNSQPHKEADESPGFRPDVSYHFNSQPHKEADIFAPAISQLPYISTHSLTRRLTLKETAEELVAVFQLTASQGG